MITLLLLEDIPGMGKENDIVVVKEGYAMNNLLPRRRALVATPTVRKRYADVIRKRAEERQKEMEFQKNASGAIAGKSILLERKATKTGKLYAAVTEKLIAEALKEQLKADIAEDAIIISEPIKSLGEHQITIKIGGQESGIKVAVKEEGKASEVAA